MTKKIKSTSEEFVESLSKAERKKFKTEYRELLFSELMLALMEEDNLSVRKLAKLAGLSPTVIQAMKTGSKKDFTLQSFLKVLKGIGCNKLIVERDGQQFPLLIK